MRFFFEPDAHFTHHATLYGVPCYVADDGEGMDVMGTNVLFDWMLTWWPSHAQFIVETARRLLLDDDYEPEGFAFRLRGPIQR